MGAVAQPSSESAHVVGGTIQQIFILYVRLFNINIQNLGDSGKSGLADINKFHKRYSVDIKFMFMSYSDIKYYS